MENIENKGAAPQDGEVTATQEGQKIYNTERTYDIGDIRKSMKLILPKELYESKDLTRNEKKVLAVILHTCRSDAYKKLGGYYPITNANLKKNAQIGSDSLTPITNHLRQLGLIDFEQGEGRTKGKQRKATRYTILFDDALVNKERFIASPINPIQSTINPTINPIQDSINPIQSTINPTINPKTLEQTDTQEDTAIEDYKVRTVYVKGYVKGNLKGDLNLKLKRYLNLNLKRDLELYLKRELDVDVNLDVNLDVDGNLERELDIDGKLDVNRDVNRDGKLDVNRDGKLDVSKNNNTVENSTLMKELIKNIIISINHNTRVNLENNTKLIESNDRNHKELIESINSNFKELTSSIELYKKEIEERDNIINKLQVEKSKLQEKNNKLQEDYSKLMEERANSKNVNENGKSDGEVKTPSIQDKILSYSLEMATKHPTKDKAWRQEQQEKALQEARQTSKVDTKVTVVENNSNNGERNYVLNKLECEITNPFINSIVHTNSYENLLKIEKDFKNEFKKCYTVHQDVLTKSYVDPLVCKFYEAYYNKLDELQQEVKNNEPSSNGNDIVQSEDNNTKDSEQKPSKEETVEETDVETSPKEDETDNTRFQNDDKTSTDSENCQEKKETTSEPSTVESKKVQVSETDTPNCEEKSKEQIVEEFEKETSTMFLIDDSKKTVQAKQVEEVQFPKTEKIVLSSEEQKQFQELVNNQSINAVIKKYTVERNFEEILTEIRKAVTIGKYQERVVQAYIDYAWHNYTFDCNVQDAMKPIEITNDDTVKATVSTQKGDSFEEFLKDKVDNIRKNAEENGSELPFGKNPKSRYQDDDESNCYQSEEEKAAMSSSSSYDESQDEMF